MKPINFLKILTGMALLLSLPGCFTPYEPESRGVKLSDAMQSSANDDHRDLGGSNSHDSSPDADVAVTAGTSDSAGFTAVSYDKTEYNWQALADVSYATPFNGDIQGITHFTLTPLSVEDERNFLGLYVGGAIVDLKPGSLPDLGVDRTWMLEAGLTYRR